MTKRGERESDWLDRMLRACDPIGGRVQATAGIESALDLIGASIQTQARTASHRRWLGRPRGTLAFIVALAAAGGVAAAATKLFIPTHTHQYQPKWAIPGAGPGEQLNLAGTDFRRVALQIASDIPYPPGFGSYRDYVIAMQLSPNDRPYPTCKPSTCRVEISTGELHGFFAMSAFVAWIVDWRRELLAGSRAAAVRDARVIEGALNWKAVRAWDPHPTTHRRDDSGGFQPSLFGWMIPYIQAVRANDLALVDQLILRPYYGGNFYGYVPGLAVIPRLTRLTGSALLKYLDQDHPVDIRAGFAFFAKGHR
jgi:hypothetical protein